MKIVMIIAMSLIVSTSGAQYANVNGIRMYYEIHGSGYPLVLIHGGGSTINTTFGTILPMLAKTHQVIAVELQAHGHTSDRNAPESFKQDAADVSELLRQLNISQADIFGFSNGGQTAMQLAIDHPQQVHKLIIASAFYKRAGTPLGFWKGFDQAKFSDMPQIYKDEFLKINDDPSALMNMFTKDSQRMLHFQDWSDDEIRSIKSPALVVMGDHDVATPEHAAELSRMIPHSSLAILPGNHGGYMGEIMSRDQAGKIPALLVEMVNEFLSQPLRERK